jgi:teichuronic acid biosynthesis glycosyltransferase TuaG
MELSNTIDVLIPCYNNVYSIEDAIRSVLDQNYEQLRILIYDDGSTDGTTELLKSFEKHNGNIIVVYSNCNRGVGVARNELLKLVTSEYVAFLDADDRWYPNKLAKQIALMERKNSKICICDYKIFSVDGLELGLRRSHRNINFYTMHLANWIPMSTAVLHSSLKAWQDMPIMRKRQDYAYWLNLLAMNPTTKVVRVSEPLVRYTRAETSLSSSKIDNLKWNYFVFRREREYTLIASICFVFLNVCIRIFRA